MSGTVGSYVEDVVIPACPRVEAGIKVGTGFVVAPDLVATAAHVVDTVKAGEEVSCYFRQDRDERKINATVAQCDQGDHALLNLKEKASDVQVLSLATDDDVRTFASDDDSSRVFRAYGYPLAAKGAGILVKGEVYVWRGLESDHKPALQLRSDSVAAGMATPIHGFSGSPVLVERKVVGHLWRIIEDPQNPGRPAFGLIYASPAAGLRSMLHDGESADLKKRSVIPLDVTLDSPGHVREPAAAAGLSNGMLQLLFQLRGESTPAGVDEVYKRWQASGLPRTIGLAHAAQRYIDLNEFDLAIRLLEGAGDSLRIRQLRALALDKAGRSEESLAILLKINEAEGDYAESRGLLAGRYKRQWIATGNKDFLIAAYEVYADAYQRTLDSFPGINAAALALYLGKAEESKRVAAEVVARLKSTPDRLDKDQWLLASMGEGYLLLGNLEEARQWYQKAMNRDRAAKQSIEVMHAQARRNLEALHLPPDSLDLAFR